MQVLIVMSRLLARLLIGLIGLVFATLILAILLVAILLGSERGTGWTLSLLDTQLDRIDGVDTRWTHTRGSLFSGLELQSVDLVFGDTQIRADAINLGIAPGALLSATLRLEPVAARGLIVALPKSDPPPEADSPALVLEGLPLPEQLPLPLAIEIPAFTLDGFDLVIDSATVYTLDRLRFFARADRNGVTIENLALRSLLADADAHVRLLDRDGRWQLDAQVDARADLPGSQKSTSGASSGTETIPEFIIAGHPLASGTPLSVQLRIAGAFDDVIELSARAHNAATPDEPIQLNLQLRDLALRPHIDLKVTWPDLEVVDLDAKRYEAVAQQPAPPSRDDAANGTHHADDIETAERSESSSSATLRGISLNAGELSLTSAIEWHPEGTADAVAEGRAAAPLLPVATIAFTLASEPRGTLQMVDLGTTGLANDAQETKRSEWTRDWSLDAALGATANSIDLTALRLTLDDATAQISGKAQRLQPLAGDDRSASVSNDLWHFTLDLAADRWTPSLLGDPAASESVDDPRPAALERLRADLSGHVDPARLIASLDATSAADNEPTSQAGTAPSPRAAGATTDQTNSPRTDRDTDTEVATEANFIAALDGLLDTLQTFNIHLKIDELDAHAQATRLRIAGDLDVGSLTADPIAQRANPSRSDRDESSARFPDAKRDAAGIDLTAELFESDRRLGGARLNGQLHHRANGDLTMRASEIDPDDVRLERENSATATRSGSEPFSVSAGRGKIEADLQLSAQDFDLRAFLPAEWALAIPRAYLDLSASLPLDHPEQATARSVIRDTEIVLNDAKLILSAAADVTHDAATNSLRARLERLRINTPGDGRLELAATALLDETLPWSFELEGERLIAARIVPGIEAIETLRVDEIALTGEGRFKTAPTTTTSGATSNEASSASSTADVAEERLASGPSGSAPTPDSALQRLEATIDIQRLSGQFRGEPLTARGRFRLDGETIEIEPLEAAFADNRLRVAGRIDQALALDAELNASRLGAIDPQLSGDVRVTAALRGPRDAPQMRLNARVNQLKAPGDVRLEALTLDANIGLSPRDPFNLNLEMRDLEVADQTVPRLSIIGEGRGDAHRIRVDFAGPEDIQLALALAGGWSIDSARWRGEVSNVTLSQPQAGTWQLADGAPLLISAERQRLQRFCLSQATASLCLDADRQDDGRLDATVDLSDFSFAQIADLLPADVQFERGNEGGLDARVEARIGAQGQLGLDANLRGRPGQLRVLDARDQVQRLSFGALDATARLRGDNAELRASLELFDQGRINTDLVATLGNVPRIRGAVTASLPDLSQFEGLIPQVRSLAGRFQADLRLDGALSSPLAGGNIELTDLAATIPEAGLDLRAPALTVAVESPSLARLSGRLESGRGALDLGGELRFGEDGAFSADATVDGQRFLAVARPDVEAEISPALRLTFAPATGLRLRGTLTIPHARIFPPDLPPGSVGVSADEIIVGQEEDRDLGSGLPIDARIRVILGDDVRFEGFGLEARFAGDLEVIEAPGRGLGLFGEISIPEGAYRAYGQDLRIQRGTILFQGPADTPDLDIYAARTVRRFDVTVGVEVGGTPTDLRSRVVSQPPMDDTEAMSFLITGRPLSGASAEEGNIIAGAAATFGLEQAAGVTNRIGEELGFDEFGVSGENGLDQAAFSIGKYLSPSLLLRYSAGLFDQSQLVLLRYELTRSLAIETSSGTRGQGIEFLYRFER
ncbi:MAG: translocation/assembly module TamB domain-containing protein [Thioalkalivibrionaceae bacterium]